jgi:hypothetical protein
MNACTRIFGFLSVTMPLLAAMPASAQQPVACPPSPVRVVRSAGGVIDYLGTVPGIPELCRMTRADGTGDFYFGAWRSDWPGAGLAYPAIRAVMTGAPGTRASFVTRSAPGLQWTDIYINQGIEPIEVDGRRYEALKLAHERDGIEGNTYHSVITTWRDVATGVALQVVENQIAGQSYGPDTTWRALHVTPLPP